MGKKLQNSYPTDYNLLRAQDLWQVYKKILQSLKHRKYYWCRLHALKKSFKITDLGEYQDLYVQSDTLLLADVFKIFQNTCLETYELDAAHFLIAPELAW